MNLKTYFCAEKENWDSFFHFFDIVEVSQDSSFHNLSILPMYFPQLNQIPYPLVQKGHVGAGD